MLVTSSIVQSPLEQEMGISVMNVARVDPSHSYKSLHHQEILIQTCQLSLKRTNKPSEAEFSFSIYIHIHIRMHKHIMCVCVCVS